MYTHSLSVSLSHPHDPYAKSTSLTCQPRQITCQRSQACIRSDDVEYSYIKYLLYTYGNCILYASMYVYIYISLYVYIRMYVPPAYSRCFISSHRSRALMPPSITRAYLLSLPFSLSLFSFAHSFSLSLSLAFTQFFFSLLTLCPSCVFRMTACLFADYVSLKLCACVYVSVYVHTCLFTFLHKILRTRRFYKTLPWNNVLLRCARRPIAKERHGSHLARASDVSCCSK